MRLACVHIRHCYSCSALLNLRGSMVIVDINKFDNGLVLALKYTTEESASYAS